MSRYTQRDEYGNADIIGVDSADLQLNLEFKEFNRVTDALNRLAAYEDAEEQGLLVRLPCKAGERWMRDGKRYIVAEISVTSAWGIMVRHYEEGDGKMLSCNPQYFAKHYTRAEAEAALKEAQHE
jgi:hypothetical protein